MVIVFEAHAAVIPAGNPVVDPIPVAPVVVWVISVKAVLIHTLGLELAALAVLSADTFMVPVALTLVQPPVNGIE